VCDVDALAAQLGDDHLVLEAWTTPLAVDPATYREYLDALTPVVLLRDTTVIDHVLQGGRIVSRSAILQRGTAVLVDGTGVPRVRCVSGSPLRTAAPTPAGVAVTGAPW
jgi:hypothetical protein